MKSEVYVPMMLRPKESYEHFEGRVRFHFAEDVCFYHLEDVRPRRGLISLAGLYYWDTIVTVVP